MTGRERVFQSRVAQRGPDECWPWIGPVNKWGYGKAMRRGREQNASRIAWEFAKGQPAPDGLHVLHTCDNPSCCNPAHLWLGTHQDNMADKMRKGRANFKYKLSDGDVRAIRNSRAPSVWLSAAYGVHFQTVSGIKRERIRRDCNG